MKKFNLLAAILLLSSAAFCQDMLGSKISEIKHTTSLVKGISVSSRGDSVIKVSNSHLERYFEFRFDPISNLCIQEDVQLDVTDLRNMIILQKFLHSKKLVAINVTEGESLYETKSKMVHILRRGNLLNISFTVKSLSSQVRNVAAISSLPEGELVSKR